MSGDYRGSEHQGRAEQKLYLQQTPAGLLFDLDAFESHPKRILQAEHKGIAKNVAEHLFVEEWQSEDHDGNPAPALFCIAIHSSGEVEVSTAFTLEIGDVTGAIHFCFPYAMLEPIRDTLYSTVQGDAVEPDKRWVNLLKSQIQDAEVELVVELATARATVEQLLGFRPGDFVELDMEPVIQAKVDGVPVFDCQYGVNDGHYAIKIEKLLTSSETGWLGVTNHGR